MTGTSQSLTTTTSPSGFRVMRVLGAIILIIVGAIHIYLLFGGVGGTLFLLFLLNGIAGIVLGLAMLVFHGLILKLATVLGLLFDIASLAALLLALTVGLFGITETWSYTLVLESVIVEAIGVVVLAIASAMVLRRPATR